MRKRGADTDLDFFLVLTCLCAVLSSIMSLTKKKIRACELSSLTSSGRLYLLGSWSKILAILPPPQRVAHLVMLKISVGRDQKKPTTSFNGQNSTPNGLIPNSRLHGPISTASFSKSLNSQDHLYRAWRYPHSSPISCLGVYYDNSDCHILCAQA